MSVKKKLFLSLLVVTLLFGAVACGDDDNDSTSSSSEATSSSEASSSEASSSEASTPSGDLSACPDPIVIQTDWFPESEHGAMYELFGDGDYSIDSENLIVTGTLHDEGTDTGIGLEVRTGGPAIGFSPVASYMYTDEGITFGYANTEAQVTFFESAPLLSVVAPLEKNPQMVMWDPETYPDVETLADLGEQDITISVFGGGVFAEVFIAQGIWSADQVDPSYDGSPANFIANGGQIAQQGFASAEPYDYENVFTDWGKPVKLQLLHDAGFPVYSQTVAIRSAEKEELDSCLKAFVPVVQRAVVSFIEDPSTANGIIIDAVDTFGSFWVYSEGLAEFSVSSQLALGLVGNGPNGTVGDMEETRIKSIITIMDDAGIDTGGITTQDIYTNEYIDPDIGFDTGDLSACPDPIVIQTDWFPESEHGAMYELFGDGDYSIDSENLIVTGTLHDEGTDTGIGLEVRTGGPAIGFSPVASYMYTDEGITFGYANTEAQVTFFESAPLLSVVAPLEKNPQMVMWDPETYPDVETLADLGEQDITISVFGGGVFAEVFIAQGIWSADQVDPSYDGSPANFIANGGQIAQQGFASAEPYDYENVFTDWGKPVKLQLLHDAGFPVYSQTVAIRSAEKEELDSCLKAFVPVVQRAVVSFIEDPSTANGIIIDAVDTFGSFWVYSEGLAEFSVSSQLALGLVGNGPNGTVGDMEETRIKSIITIMDDAGIDTGGITTQDIYTNEYIDHSIGF